MTARDVARDDLKIGELLGAGAEGRVWRCDRTVLGEATVYKQYDQSVRPKVNFELLRRMPGRLEALDPADASQLFELTAWPVAIVHDSPTRTPIGFVMRAVPNRFLRKLVLPSGRESLRLAELALVLNSDSYITAKLALNFDLSTRLELLARLAEAVAFLHRMRIVVGDFSPRNVLFSAEPDDLGVFFIDCDGMRVFGSDCTPQAETPLWDVQSVSGESWPSVDSDVYKFGLAALRLLAGTQDGRDTSELWGTAPDLAVELVEQCLSRDPLRRPSMTDVRAVLGQFL